MKSNIQNRRLLKGKIYRLIKVYDNPELCKNMLVKDNLVNRTWPCITSYTMPPVWV